MTDTPQHQDTVPPPVPGTAVPGPVSPRVDNPSAGWGSIGGSVPGVPGDSSGTDRLEALERRFGLSDRENLPPAVPGPVPGSVPQTAGAGGITATVPVPSVPEDRRRSRGDTVVSMGFGELLRVAWYALPTFLVLAVPTGALLVLGVAGVVAGPLLCGPGGSESFVCQPGPQRFLATFGGVLYLLGLVAAPFLGLYAIAVVSQVVRRGRARASTAAVSALGAVLKYIGVLLVMIPVYIGVLAVLLLASLAGSPLVVAAVMAVTFGVAWAILLLLVSTVVVDLARSA